MWSHHLICKKNDSPLHATLEAPLCLCRYTDFLMKTEWTVQQPSMIRVHKAHRPLDIPASVDHLLFYKNNHLYVLLSGTLMLASSAVHTLTQFVYVCVCVVAIDVHRQGKHRGSSTNFSCVTKHLSFSIYIYIYIYTYIG